MPTASVGMAPTVLIVVRYYSISESNASDNLGEDRYPPLAEDRILRTKESAMQNPNIAGGDSRRLTGSVIGRLAVVNSIADEFLQIVHR